MQILSYKLDAIVPFDNESIESFLVLCEDAVSKMISDEQTIFKLKSAIHELLINSLEHGYKKEGGKIHFYVEKNDKTSLWKSPTKVQVLIPDFWTLIAWVPT